MTDPTSPTDFEAAAAVAAALKDLPKPRQELVLRWVAESLGIVVPQALPASPAPTPPIVAPHPAAHHTPTPPPTAAHPVDIASFVAHKKPKTDIQFVTVVAYYHRFVAAEASRLKTITVEIAQDATRLADWDRLTNAGSTLNNAKRQGYLDSAGPGSSRSTRSARTWSPGRYLETASLPSVLRPRTGARRRVLPRRTRSASRRPCFPNKSQRHCRNLISHAQTSARDKPSGQRG